MPNELTAAAAAKQTLYIVSTYTLIIKIRSKKYDIMEQIASSFHTDSTYAAYPKLEDAQKHIEDWSKCWASWRETRRGRYFSKIIYAVSVDANAKFKPYKNPHPIEEITEAGSYAVPREAIINIDAATYLEAKGKWFSVNKHPTRMGLNQAITPYTHAWNSTAGDKNAKTTAVLERYKAGAGGHCSWLRSHKAEAQNLIDNIKKPEQFKRQLAHCLFKMPKTNYNWFELIERPDRKGDFQAALAVIEENYTGLNLTSD